MSVPAVVCALDVCHILCCCTQPIPQDGTVQMFEWSHGRHVRTWSICRHQVCHQAWPGQDCTVQDCVAVTLGTSCLCSLFSPMP